MQTSPDVVILSSCFEAEPRYPTRSRCRTARACADECQLETVSIDRELALKDVDAVEMLHEQSRVEVLDAAVHLRR